MLGRGHPDYLRAVRTGGHRQAHPRQGGDAKRYGKYCGAQAILGFNVEREQKKLFVNPEEAPLIQHILRRFIQLALAKALAAGLNEQGYRTKAWTTKKGIHRPAVLWNTGHIYRLLGSRTHRIEVVHKGNSYPGEHEAIVSKGLWEEVQTVFSENTRAKQAKARTKSVRIPLMMIS